MADPGVPHPTPTQDMIRLWCGRSGCVFLGQAMTWASLGRWDVSGTAAWIAGCFAVVCILIDRDLHHG